MVLAAAVLSAAAFGASASLRAHIQACHAFPGLHGFRTTLGYVPTDRIGAERPQRLGAKPSSVLREARLCLGRVLTLSYRDADAQAQLGRAAAKAPDDAEPTTGYLAALFLGQLHEEAGRSDAAVSSYQLAISRNPTTVVGRLALGQLLIRSGRPDEGWDLVRQAVASSESRAIPLDPYYTCRGPGFARLPGAVEESGTSVRQW